MFFSCCQVAVLSWTQGLSASPCDGEKVVLHEKMVFKNLCLQVWARGRTLFTVVYWGLYTRANQFLFYFQSRFVDWNLLYLLGFRVVNPLISSSLLIKGKKVVQEASNMNNIIYRATGKFRIKWLISLSFCLFW